MTLAPYHSYLHPSIALVLKVWFLDQQHQHHLGLSGNSDSQAPLQTY